MPHPKRTLNKMGRLVTKPVKRPKMGRSIRHRLRQRIFGKSAGGLSNNPRIDWRESTIDCCPNLDVSENRGIPSTFIIFIIFPTINDGPSTSGFGCVFSDTPISWGVSDVSHDIPTIKYHRLRLVNRTQRFEHVLVINMLFWCPKCSICLNQKKISHKRKIYHRTDLIPHKTVPI